MSEQTKSAITAAIITTWPSILFILLNHLNNKITLISFLGIIISYTALFTLILLHLWRSKYFKGWGKKSLYFLPITIYFFSVGFNELFKPPMTKFTDEVFGILVANFKGETNETKIQGMEIKNPIISNLEKEFEVKKTKINVRIKPLNETIIPNTGEARIWGVKYNANIVLYGRIIGSVKKKIKFFHGLL